MLIFLEKTVFSPWQTSSNQKQDLQNNINDASLKLYLLDILTFTSLNVCVLMNLSLRLFSYLFPQTFAETFAVDNFLALEYAKKIAIDCREAAETGCSLRRVVKIVRV
ncbi:MAG: hypothetical protein JWQ30_2460 [Sediminibacterium sp.]|nr:hypothetical protein [Sediminibacterium sp.]